MSSCCHHHAHDSVDEELKDLRRRFYAALLLGLPVVILAMAPMLLEKSGSAIFKNWGEKMSAPFFSWAQFFLTLLLLFWIGSPIWKKGWDSFRARQLNMFSLLSVGMGAAFFYSSSELFFANFDFYFESAATMMVLVLLGQLLEARGQKKTNTALRSLLELVPERATRLNQEREESVLVSELRVGDHLRIHPGEKIPVDGVVVEGSSFLDEAMVTGESLPVEKKQGASVIAGTLNGHGSFVMHVEKIGDETLLAQMIALVEKAQQSRAPVQNLADRVSAIFVPTIFGIALLTFGTWIFLNYDVGFALARAIAVLMIACPCTIGLATPMTFAVGLGKAASRGVLVRDVSGLQALSTATLMVLDKTGTLTEGQLHVVDFQNFSSHTKKEFFSLLTAAERGSEHAIARALVHYGEEQQIIEKKASSFLAEAGGGICAEVDGINILVGNEHFLKNHAVDLSEFTPQNKKAYGFVFVAFDGKLAGVVFLSDTIKASAADFFKQLSFFKIEPAMLTGDRVEVAQSVANQLGIKRWKGALLPEQKADQLCQWKKEGKKVVMVGDGINDALALSVADASIAVHGGTNIAKESAHIILMRPSLNGIITALLLSRAILKTIRQNLFFAFGYNLVGVSIATGILYPWFGLLLSPMIATAVMSLSSLSVIANALRLKNKI